MWSCNGWAVAKKMSPFTVAFLLEFFCAILVYLLIRLFFPALFFFFACTFVCYPSLLCLLVNVLASGCYRAVKRMKITQGRGPRDSRS